MPAVRTGHTTRTSTAGTGCCGFERRMRVRFPRVEPRSEGKVDLSDRTALREAIDRIRKRAGLTLDAKTEQAFFAGQTLGSVYYDKLGGPTPAEPALARML